MTTTDPRAWLAEAQERAREYRGTMDLEVVHDWAVEVVADAIDVGAALTAVLDLHYPLNGPHEHLVCAHRHCIDDAGDQCRWPCMTARAVTENLPKEDA